MSTLSGRRRDGLSAYTARLNAGHAARILAVIGNEQAAIGGERHGGVAQIAIGKSRTHHERATGRPCLTAILGYMKRDAEGRNSPARYAGDAAIRQLEQLGGIIANIGRGWRSPASPAVLGTHQMHDAALIVAQQHDEPA